MGGEVVGAHPGERAAVLAERGAHRVQDVYVGHCGPFCYERAEPPSGCRGRSRRGAATRAAARLGSPRPAACGAYRRCNTAYQSRVPAAGPLPGFPVLSLVL
ncbi:hypothetical protein GCM10023405_02390 [Streptomonospora salina]